jgi:hypothetical protein
MLLRLITLIFTPGCLIRFGVGDYGIRDFMCSRILIITITIMTDITRVTDITTGITMVITMGIAADITRTGVTQTMSAIAAQAVTPESIRQQG